MRHSPCTSTTPWLAILSISLLFSAPAWSDIRIERKTVSQGLMGFGDGTSTSVLTVAGDKSVSDDEYTYTGRFKTFVGKKPKKSVSIVRLDKELIWSVEIDKKRYTEMSFSEMREMMKQGMADAEAKMAEAQAPGAGTPQDANFKFTLDVKKTGEKQELSGFPCERVIVTAVGKSDPPQPESLNVEIRMVFDQWMTKSVPGEKELIDYYKAFAEKLGLDAQLSQIAPMARQMYGKGIQQLTEKLKDVQGTAIRSTFTIEGPPPSAQQTEGSKQAVEDMKKASAERQNQDKAQDVADAASIGSSAAKGQDVKGGLGGFMGRKLANSLANKLEKSAIKSAETGSGPLFKVVTDVVSYSSTPAPAGAFEVPAGFKRVDREDK